ncbi:hypothetical protein D9M68_321030 [compost metagenome]
MANTIDDAIAAVGAIGEKIEGIGEDHARLAERVLLCEQGMHGGHNQTLEPGGRGAIDPFEPFHKSASLSDFAHKRSHSAVVQLTAAQTGELLRKSFVHTDGASSAPGWIAAPVTSAPMPAIGGPTVRVSSLFVVVPSSDHVSLTRESSATAAGEQLSQGAAKSESDLVFSEQSLLLTTSATLCRVSRQALLSRPELERWLTTRLSSLVLDQLDRKIIATLSDAENHVEYDTVSDSGMTTLRLAQADAENRGYPPTTVILNPLDAGSMDVAVDGEGRYLNPAASVAPWGLRGVRSPALESGKFIELDPAICGSVFQLEGLLISFSDSDQDNFQKNLITIRAELTASLGVNVPGAVTYGDLTAATP